MEFKNFNRFGYKVFCSEVQDGQMDMQTEQGQQNAKAFLSKVGAFEQLCYMTQVHGAEIVFVDRPGSFESVDGLIADQDFTLAVKTADCIPVVFCAENSKIFGAIHAGRKSITEGILSDSLAQKIRELSLSPEDIFVFLGPHIRKENYNLLEGTFEALKDTKWTQFISNREGQNYFDMTAAATWQLVKVGVLKENIIDSGIDTFDDPAFFSARQDPDNPNIRFLTVIFHEPKNK